MSALQVVVPAQITELERKAMPWPAKAQALQVVDQETHDRAAEELLVIKDLEKEVEEHHRPMIESAHAAHKAALAAKAKLLDPLKAAEVTYKTRIFNWEEERRREAEAERRRIEAEARARAEAELEAAIEQAEAAGASAVEVEAMIEQAPEPVFIPEVRTFEPAKGVSAAGWTYSVEVTNMRELCRAIADGRAADNLVEPSTVLSGMARALKDRFNIPGCKLVKTPRVSAGRR